MFCDFDKSFDELEKIRQPGESFCLSIHAEISDYIRFNHARIRQAGRVSQAEASLSYQTPSKSVSLALSLTDDINVNTQRLNDALLKARNLANTLHDDPYCVPFEKGESSQAIFEADLPPVEETVSFISDIAKNLDLVGLLTQGRVLRYVRHTENTKHLFETQSLVFDYSIYSERGKDGSIQSVKQVVYATKDAHTVIADSLAKARQQLLDLAKPIKTLTPGNYRVYLEPAAVGDIVFSWNGVSAASYKKGASALMQWIDGKVTLSPKVSIADDFNLGLSPRFNSRGELAPSCLAIADKGHFANLLVSSRTAKEYGLTSTFATGSEGLRSINMAPGTLEKQSILTALGTGIYISNVHYLNWSDPNSARITGMTRFACFWVENGVIQGPIQDMRFDDSIYSIFGEQLEAITAFTEVLPETSTYEERSIGGSCVPGVLVKEMAFTL